MSFETHLGMAISQAPLVGLAVDLRAVAHKLRYPMAAILAKVPGDTLAERARTIGVSRQTMYVWAQERFRPSTPQAERISQLTGIPAEQIGDYQEGKHDGVTKSPRKKTARVAKVVRRLSPGAARLRAKRTGMGLEPGKRRYGRKARQRDQGRPSGDQSD